MLRIIGSILAGYCIIGLLVVVTDQVFAAVIPGFKSMPIPPDYYFAISLVTDTLYTVAGGYLCARIAANFARTATLGLIVFGEVMGLVSLVMSWKTVPHWYGVALLVIYPPAVWAGSRIKSRTVQRAAGIA
jgi:hypothetical protein